VLIFGGAVRGRWGAWAAAARDAAEFRDGESPAPNGAGGGRAARKAEKRRNGGRRRVARWRKVEASRVTD